MDGLVLIGAALVIIAMCAGGLWILALICMVSLFALIKRP